MSTLQAEQNLLFDPGLAKLLEGAKAQASARAWEAAATALNLRSMPNLAADLCHRGLKRHPASLVLWRERILATALSQEVLESVRHQLARSRKAPKEREALLALVDYYLELDAEGLDRLGKVPKALHGALYWQVLGHYATAVQEHKRAAVAYAESWKRDPKDLRSLYHLAEAFHALGRTGDARKNLLWAVHQERHFVQAWNALCRLQLEAGEVDLAHQSLGMALSVNPRDWGAYFAFADYHLGRGEYARARGVIEEILELSPRPVIAAEAYNYLGYAHFLDEEPASAAPCFQRALSLNPLLSVAWLNLGNLHFHRKSHEEALACYEEAVKAEPGLASAHTQIGLCHLETGQLDRVRKPLETAVAYDPEDHMAHLGLSEFHRRTRNFVGALEEARLAHSLAPSDPNVHNNLGIVLECNRRYFDAEKAYRRALELDPGHRWAANNLGYLCEKLMRVDDSYKAAAVDAWKRRLLICRDTRVSMRGATNHLRRLGVSATTLREWMALPPLASGDARP